MKSEIVLKLKMWDLMSKMELTKGKYWWLSKNEREEVGRLSPFGHVIALGDNQQDWIENL